MQNRLPRRTRRRQLPWICLAVILAGALALAWNFPARWAMPWVERYLHGAQLRQVHGSLWRGRADRVVAPDGRELGRASWQVSRRVVYASVPVQVHLDGPDLAFSANVRMLPGGQSRWDQVSMRADLGAWSSGAPWPGAQWSGAQWPGIGQPVGDWRMTADHVLLQGGWPLQLQLHARWRDAALRTERGLVALGELECVASANEGVVDVHLHDVGDGPLQVNGQLLLSPLGWRLSARLRPRRADPVLRAWLAGLGPADASGAVNLQRRGGMALASPGAPASTFSASLPGPR